MYNEAEILATNAGILSGPEPLHASVVLAQGATGTAWQRFFSDGKWHSVTGKVRTWDELSRQQANLVLVYEPYTEIDRP